MSATLESLSDAVGNEASDELDGALRKIKHCVNGWMPISNGAETHLALA